MRAKDYAKATYEVIESGMPTAKAFTHLESLLKKRGHTKLRNSIYASLLSYAYKCELSQVPTLTLAKDTNASALQEQIADAMKTLGISTTPEVIEQENIIGGFSLQHTGKYIDATYKTKLLQLYRNIITNS